MTDEASGGHENSTRSALHFMEFSLRPLASWPDERQKIKFFILKY